VEEAGVEIRSEEEGIAQLRPKSLQDQELVVDIGSYYSHCDKTMPEGKVASRFIEPSG
jgi:hypothetical protein